MTGAPLIPALLLSIALPVAGARAQGPGAPDSVRYADLVAAATRADPRSAQLPLHERTAALRLRGIASERLPALGATGQAQHQSAVTRIAIPVPGLSLPAPKHDSYDAHLTAEETPFDPTRAGRRELERARLAESKAQLRGALFGLRQEVAEAYFAAALLQQRLAETDGALAELGVRLQETVARFREGAALRADTASLAATLTERRQDRLALASERAAALSRLSLLTGRSVGERVVLSMPATAERVRDAARVIDTLRARPEFEQFTAARQRLAEQSRLLGAQERPRVSAYGRVGYGRPGLNMLSQHLQGYWLAGVQLRWSPLRWGATDRERELLEIERELVASNEAAFGRALLRTVQPVLATIARLDSTLALDEQAIALREQVVRDAQAQLREGAITAATYADRSTELLTARLRRVQHRVALEQARVTLLNTLGMEVQ